MPTDIWLVTTVPGRMPTDIWLVTTVPGRMPTDIWLEIVFLNGDESFRASAELFLSDEECLDLGK